MTFNTNILNMYVCMLNTLYKSAAVLCFVEGFSFYNETELNNIINLWASFNWFYIISEW